MKFTRANNNDKITGKSKKLTAKTIRNQTLNSVKLYQNTNIRNKTLSKK